jgi:gamma-polyglutamate synthase
MKSSTTLAKEWLSAGMDADWQRINGALIGEFSVEWSLWLKKRILEGDAGLGDKEQIGAALVAWLLRYIDVRRLELDSLLSIQSRFISDHDRAKDRQERERIILDFAQELGATGRQLRGDRQALKRWFDRDAVVDRFLYRRARQEHRLAFALDRIGVVSANVIKRAITAGQPTKHIWTKLALEKPLRHMFSHEGDHRVARAAFRALADSLLAFPKSDSGVLVEESTLRYIYRSALESRQNIWIQAVAMEILEFLSPDSLEIVLTRRLGSPQGGDDLFVRRRALPLLIRNLTLLPNLSPLLDKVIEDPRPYVRQGLAESLAKSDGIKSVKILTRLATNDAEPAVRAAAILALANHFDSSVSEFFVSRMSEEKEPFVFRALLHTVVTICRSLSIRPAEKMNITLIEKLYAAVTGCTTDREEIILRRWAAQEAEKIWLTLNPTAWSLMDTLSALVINIPQGSSRSVSARLIRSVPEETIGRVLAILAQDDFPLELEKGFFGYHIHRGHRFGFRWWRLFHELRHPSSDKREAFSHLIGRHFKGHIRAPSLILNEMSPTKVPGEPLHIESEGGWRPYLPLPDDMISVLEQGRKTTLYCSQGSIEITPPRWLLGRVKALTVLSWKFAKYAALRNEKLDQSGDPKAYLDSLSKLGFKIEFSPYYKDT